MASISVLILTKNEAHDIAGCLASVAALSTDVHVLDSGSTDDTCAIAASLGATVTVRAFDNFAAQRNFGLHDLPYRNDWVLMLDADERIGAALIEEFHALVAGCDADVAAARMGRRDFWLGTHLRHATISPFNIRLVRRSRVHFEREINEVLVVDGAVAELRHPFDHYPFSKGMVHWLNKHNLYSTMEAELIAQRKAGKPDIGKAFFARDPNERRMHQKRLFYRAPARPLIKFLYMFIWRRSFLDGVAGLHYTMLQCIYEYMIVLKTREQLERMSEEAGTGASAAKPSVPLAGAAVKSKAPGQA
ncbi:glycosyltransferase family 2 protein [Cupriavidus pauculus]|uniref:Glycosyl transferase family 2 n=1 Tax=Cupriavidus pauculus TaxID=82633 RepID=A0A2N5C4K7_9BURK|nr:glycosyltransferase family 2 protein [Cupriavidus pauculus]PLP97148.1 glycosyl transferase family 2 [Cupriavidus pauculus]